MRWELELVSAHCSWKLSWHEGIAWGGIAGGKIDCSTALVVQANKIHDTSSALQPSVKSDLWNNKLPAGDQTQMLLLPKSYSSCS